jgi:hypothetical protein
MPPVGAHLSAHTACATEGRQNTSGPTFRAVPFTIRSDRPVGRGRGAGIGSNFPQFRRNFADCADTSLSPSRLSQILSRRA